MSGFMIIKDWAREIGSNINAENILAVSYRYYHKPSGLSNIHLLSCIFCGPEVCVWIGYLFSLNQGWVLIQSFYWGRIHFLTPIVIGSIQFLAVIRLKALVLACCLPESTCSASACTVYQLGWFLPVSQHRNNCSKRDATIFYNIAM